jgi:hypothetical protein
MYLATPFWINALSQFSPPNTISRFFLSVVAVWEEVGVEAGDVSLGAGVGGKGSGVEL